MAKQKVRGNGVSAGQLRGFIARLERLAEERAHLSDDTKAVMAEAKAAGYDTKIIRLLLRERRRDESEIAEEEEMLRLYRDAMGIEGTPLAEWAATLDEVEVAIAPESKRRAKRTPPDDPRPAEKKSAPKAVKPTLAPKAKAEMTGAEIAKAQGLTELDPATRAAIAWGTGGGDDEPRPAA